jgi:hypothetical protein
MISCDQIRVTRLGEIFIYWAMFPSGSFFITKILGNFTPGKKVITNFVKNVLFLQNSSGHADFGPNQFHLGPIFRTFFHRKYIGQDALPHGRIGYPYHSGVSPCILNVSQFVLNHSLCRTLQPLRPAQPELPPAPAGIPGTHFLWPQSFSTVVTLSTLVPQTTKTAQKFCF